MTFDPRHENCRGFRFDANGKVVGINLEYRERPAARFYLKSVKLLDEYEAKGNTTATVYLYDKDGLPTEELVLLGYPWTGDLPVANLLSPGSASRPVQHVIASPFDAAAGVIGPLCIFVADRAGNPISDVIGGLGLPGYIDPRTKQGGGVHVSFVATFMERGTASDPAPDPDPVPDPGDQTAVAEELHAMNVLLADIRDLIKAGFRL